MEEKERYEYYPKQNQLYDKINDELYCLGIKQDKTRLVDFLNLMNEDWWTLYERNKELREENQQLKQQLAESEKKNFELVAKINLKEHKPAFCTLADRDCEALWQVEELQKQLSEKDKEYQSFKKIADENVNYLKNRILEETRNYNQDKISFAIDKLEKVKELLNTDFESTISWIDSYEDGEYLNSMTYNHNNTIKIIDNQIKQLKEEV